VQWLSDSELMIILAEGSEPALGELFLRHHQRVFALAYRTLGDWNTAEDITQETFLRVWRAAAKYKPSAEFTVWLCRIVVNLCFDEMRRCRRFLNVRKTITFQQYDNAISGSQPEEETGRSNKIWRALMKLNERQRHVVVLHKFHGLTYNEIADRTGWTQSAVDSLLTRAYRKLRKELGGIKQPQV